MPHDPRRTLLLALALLLLAPPLSLAQAPARAKSPGPGSHSFPVDPAQLTPEQRAKIAEAGSQAIPAPIEVPARMQGLQPRPAEAPLAPVPVSPAERAVLDARSKAKLAVYQKGPQPRQSVPRATATAKRPPAWKPPSKRTTGTQHPELTPAERAKAEAAGIRIPPAEVRR